MQLSILRLFPLALGVISLAVNVAHADLIIEFDNVRMDAGRTGVIDVFVRSRDTDQVAQYNLQFVVEHVRGQGIMEFQPDAFQSDSETRESNYLFAGESLAFRAIRDANERNRITQSDFALENVTVGASLADRRLVGRLELNHIVTGDALATFPGAEYRVSLFRSNAQTFFADNLLERVAIDNVSYSNFGTISISPVPEPSGLFLVATFGVVLLVRRRSRTMVLNGSS